MAKPGSAPTLAGWYVISLRPSGTHAPVQAAAAAEGARVLELSTLALEALPAGPSLAAALACPAVVVTSPAAVRFAREQAPLRPLPGQAWFALGEGSARALADAGVGGVRVPAQGTDSEALLALPGLQAPLAMPVGLVTAPGGRGLIGETLAARGAQVHLAEVYQRVPVTPPPEAAVALASLPPASALLVSSSEAFERLWAWLDEPGRQRLRERPAVASSARLAAMLAGHGFQAIVLADGATPARLVAALAADVGQGRFR